jgi:tellurite resistance protein
MKEIAPQTQASFLDRVKAPIFAAPMGLFGLGHVLAGLYRAEGGLFSLLSEGVFVFAGVLLIGLSLAYGVKCALKQGAFWDDFKDPVAMNFGSAFAIAVLLGARALDPYAPSLAEPLLVFGGAASFGFGVLVVRQWLTSPFAPEAICPPWFVPVAGNLVAAKALFDGGFEGLGFFFGGLGLVGWAMLLPILLYRLVVSPELPMVLRPTLFIFVAPPGLTASASLSLLPPEAGVLFASLALGFGLFFLAVLATMVRNFEKAQFTTAWWSYTFPTAAMASGGLSLAAATGSSGQMMVGHGLAGLNIALTLGVMIASLRHLRG